MVLLSLAMLLTFMPAMAFADDAADKAADQAEAAGEAAEDVTTEDPAEEESMSSEEQEETENVVKELRLAISGLDTINPIISANKHVQEISRIIFDSLIELDENFAINGGLAEEIEKAEEKV